MKLNVLSFLIFVFFTVLSCESSKSAQKNSDMISKIKLEKVTMGSSSALEITQKEILSSTTDRNGTGDAAAGNTSEKDWNEINRLVGKLDLSKIDQWEGPTQARFYDGAMATTIIIESNGQTYNSQSFDEGQPPAQLKELYDYLESLVNQ